MAKNRIKQRAHLASSVTKEERLAWEAAQKEAEEERLSSEETSLFDFCGIKDPTPYQAFKRIDARNKNVHVT